MPYRLTLMENLPADPPSSLAVRYTYNNGNNPTTWQVTAVGQVTNKNVITVDTPVNLITIPNVETRKLIAHYPVAPITRAIVISSVQPSTVSDATSDAEQTQYSVQIDMSNKTVDDLTRGGFHPYGFKAVKIDNDGASPLIWFQTTTLGLTITLTWKENYGAYTSLSKIVPNGEIMATNPYKIELGQTLQVKTVAGTGDVVGGGTEEAISIHNKVNKPFTCGISQTQPDGNVTPMCAFPLHGGNLDVISPIAKILLMFATKTVNTGTVIERAYSRGILVDLTGQNSRKFTYDINGGWDWGGAAWGKQIDANASLALLLIEKSTSLAKR